MSNNQNTNKNNTNEPKFNEYQAYEELRLIFVIAIETQNFTNIEARISAWEKKYPLAEFTNPEIIRKIKTILNKDFLSRLLGDYLAAKVLHEQEKQKEAYNSLKTIIDNAKKSKDYKTAQKEIRKWKDNLHSNGFSLYSFDRVYRARVCTLLLLPSKELKNQEQATEELKKIKEDGNTMDSESYSKAISNWQNTYSIPDFPEKLQRELNKITTEVFDSISQKRTSENAISEIEEVLSSKDTSILPANAIALILAKYDYKHFPQDAIASIENLNAKALSIQASLFDNGMDDIDLTKLATFTPTEARAIVDLKDILNKTPHDMDRILNWIYVNRKISYSEFARENIVKQFSSVGYKIPVQSSYSIPEINTNLNYQNFSEIDNIRRDVILNYLGIISQGNNLTIEGKDNLSDAHAISVQESLTQEDSKPIMFLEVFDTVVDQPETESEKLYDEKGEIVADAEEEVIYNIIIEDIIDNPLATYSIEKPTKPNETVAPEQLPQESKENSDQPINPSNVEESVIPEENFSKILENSSKSKNKTNHNTSTQVETYNDISNEINTDTTIIAYDSSDEKSIDTTSSSGDAISEGPLTKQDDKNIEQAQDLSSYIIVAAPILAQALEPKLDRTHRKIGFFDKNKDL